jgi:hypothetical protein
MDPKEALSILHQSIMHGCNFPHSFARLSDALVSIERALNGTESDATGGMANGD